MISVSIIFSTGEKKWMPMNSSGRLDAAASDVIGMVDVFEPNTAVAGITASAALVIVFLSSEFSNTASTTRSTSFKAP